MALKKYLEIRDHLEYLNRRDGYKLLLSTREWEDFRNTVLELDSHVCSRCGRKEGHIEEPIPEEEWQIMLEDERKWQEEHRKFMEKLFRGASNKPISLKPFVFKSSSYQSRIVGKVILQIHHKQYFWNKLPWEYAKKHVATLCKECHTNVHETNTIYSYLDETMRYRKELIACDRCSGTGFLTEYDYWFDGICFNCGGLGLLNDGVPDWQLTN